MPQAIWTIRVRTMRAFEGKDQQHSIGSRSCRVFFPGCLNLYSPFRETMDNSTRSERSRKAAIQAALAVIARDGPGQLTFDAVARESGISKGGLMHQFPSKGALMKGLLEYQVEYFENFSREYIAGMDPAKSEVTLTAQIATMRAALTTPHSVAFVILAALVEDPGLLSMTRDIDLKTIQRIKAEAADPELSILRSVAAMGLVMTSLFGLSPFSEKERDRLFDRLLDERQWPSSPKGKKPRSVRPVSSSGRSTRRS